MNQVATADSQVSIRIVMVAKPRLVIESADIGTPEVPKLQRAQKVARECKGSKQLHKSNTPATTRIFDVQATNLDRIHHHRDGSKTPEIFWNWREAGTPESESTPSGRPESQLADTCGKVFHVAPQP